MRRQVKAEPLFGKTLDRAIGLCRRDGIVEHRLQFRIALAQADRAAGTKKSTLETRAYDDHV